MLWLHGKMHSSIITKLCLFQLHINLTANFFFSVVCPLCLRVSGLVWSRFSNRRGPTKKADNGSYPPKRHSPSSQRAASGSCKRRFNRKSTDFILFPFYIHWEIKFDNFPLVLIRSSSPQDTAVEASGRSCHGWTILSSFSPRTKSTW